MTTFSHHGRKPNGAISGSPIKRQAVEQEAEFTFKRISPDTYQINTKTREFTVQNADRRTAYILGAIEVHGCGEGLVERMFPPAEDQHTTDISPTLNRDTPKT